MTIQGTVVSYTPNKKIKKQAGGQYDGWELVYRNQEDEMKVLAKPIQGLRFNPALAAALNGLAPGDEFTAFTEKNEGGFLEVKTLVKGFADGVASVGSNSSAVSSRGVVSSRGSATPKSTYETPEERAKKQVVIVRQGVLNAAIASFSGQEVEQGVDAPLIIERARAFEKYVYENLNKEASKYLAVQLLDKEADQGE